MVTQIEFDSSFDDVCKNKTEINKKLNYFKKLININHSTLFELDGLNINEDHRFVEDIVLDTDNIICTTYFTTNVDPQRNISVVNDDIKYIEPWYN
jgi:hypothetical protein